MPAGYLPVMPRGFNLLSAISRYRTEGVYVRSKRSCGNSVLAWHRDDGTVPPVTAYPPGRTARRSARERGSPISEGGTPDRPVPMEQVAESQVPGTPLLVGDGARGGVEHTTVASAVEEEVVQGEEGEVGCS